MVSLRPWLLSEPAGVNKSPEPLAHAAGREVAGLPAALHPSTLQFQGCPSFLVKAKCIQTISSVLPPHTHPFAPWGSGVQPARVSHQLCQPWRRDRAEVQQQFKGNCPAKQLLLLQLKPGENSFHQELS